MAEDAPLRHPERQARIGPTDWALLLTLLPFWCLALGLHAREVMASGSLQPPVFAAPPARGEAHPTVAGFRLERESRHSGLAIGDRLLRIGDSDLRGAGYLSFDVIAFAEAARTGAAPLVYERDGVRRETSLEMARYEWPWVRLPISLSIAAISTLLLLRAPGRVQRRLFFAGFMGLAIIETPFQGPDPWATWLYLVTFNFGGAVAVGLILLWCTRFPQEVSAHHRPSPLWAGVAILFLLARLNYVLGGPVAGESAPFLTLGADALFPATGLFLVTWNYLHADPIGRRRVKWALLGGYLGLTPLVTIIALTAAGVELADFDRWFPIAGLFAVLTPIGFLVAVLRCKLFDIDRILGTAASYTTVAVGVVAAALVLVPRLAEVVSAAFGIDPAMSSVALALTAAATVVPIYQRFRPRLDRVFFAERHALESGFHKLLVDLSTSGSARELAQRLGEGFDELLRPETTVVYLRSGELYSPVFVRGQSMPDSFERRSPLITALEESRRPLVAESDSGLEPPGLGPFERAALETLGVAVVVPIRCGRDLEGFVSLGIKLSGDIYTSTNTALLGVVAEKASAELLHLRDTERLEAGDRMQTELRRYVPGAIADRIQRGGDLGAKERDVSILFVDIRGYTAYAEQRGPDEIFSFINRYTEIVSRSVREHGGSVVEFNGDGMMAVFGAPESLSHKERSAVASSCAIAGEMARARLEPGNEGLGAGIGIATGPAFVGNIQAVDRLIWSAIGNTTNLAARLQSMSRDLRASIVIDGATRHAAGELAAGFELREDVWIRGRTQPQDVYVLPLSAVG